MEAVDGSLGYGVAQEGLRVASEHIAVLKIRFGETFGGAIRELHGEFDADKEMLRLLRCSGLKKQAFSRSDFQFDVGFGGDQLLPGNWIREHIESLVAIGFTVRCLVVDRIGGTVGHQMLQIFKIAENVCLVSSEGWFEGYWGAVHFNFRVESEKH